MGGGDAMSIGRITALGAVMMLCCGQQAPPAPPSHGGLQAAAKNEPKVVTLSCDGTVADTSSAPTIPVDHQPKPIEKMGIVANLNERTVSFMGFVAPISSVDAAVINFDGETTGQGGQIASVSGFTVRTDGRLDRVTGHMVADTMAYETKKLSDPNNILTRSHYDVLCKATNRVF
jgi:hypothetical protein